MLNGTALNTGDTAIAAQATHLSIHTDTTLTSSGGESTAPRQPVTWTVGASGGLTAPSTAFTGGAASGPAKRVGYWTAATGGTFLGSSLLTGDQAFNAAGEYTVNDVSEPVTAS